MVLQYEHFLGKGVIAFTSDASCDFLREDPQAFVKTRGVQGGVVYPRQVHGDGIWEAGGSDISKAGIFEADAVVTTALNLAVAVRTADCLPLLLWAPCKGVVAAVHAGWKSTRLDIAAKTVAFMKKKYGVDAAQIRAVIGPCIRPESYPVGQDFREMFPGEVTERGGCLYFDIAAANRRQLASQGVRPENIFDCGCDTYADTSWHSFRRDGEASGRLIHAIMINGKA